MVVYLGTGSIQLCSPCLQRFQGMLYELINGVRRMNGVKGVFEVQLRYKK